tara:strand:- start:824 stop:1330 length:507 start_codon:yes stop_codon:yes gene_type:complete
MTIKKTTWTISSTDEKQHGKKENIFSFSATSNYSIKEKDLIDLFITVGQGMCYWGEAYINFRPNEAYEKGFLKIEREGGIYINTNKFDLDSLIYCVDRGDDSEIEIIDTKTVRDFINSIKSIIENSNVKGQFKANLIEALATQDFSLLDASDCDYIFQSCIFGHCVYG